MMYDLHLHTTYSDGDYSAVDLVTEAARRGLQGISVTDHNGIWGIAESAAAAGAAGLAFVGGIEVTAWLDGVDVHLLGYSRAFDEKVLIDGLQATREGYKARIQDMVARCQAAGYPAISFADIEAARRHQTQPSYISYDIAKELQQKYRLTSDAARQLTVRDGACYVPYGEWALQPAAAIKLLHAAGAVAALAHPGIIAHEHGAATLQKFLVELAQNGLDAIEVYHPFHSLKLVKMLEEFSAQHGLLKLGGSDWHGPGRYHDASFGTSGVSAELFESLLFKL